MLATLVSMISAGVLWQLGFFALAMVIAIWLARLQRNPENGVNFLDLVVDEKGRMDGVKVAYVVVLAVTTVGYVFFFMTVAMTAEGYALATVTYAGIWVVSQGANKAIARAPSPVPAVSVSAPNANVNVTGTQDSA